MTSERGYAAVEPSRADIDATAGAVLLEFGTPWCGWCQGAQPAIAKALGGHPAVRHIKVEDGSGRALGRTFAVKLWPTLVFLDSGREVARLVRPADAQVVADALERIDPMAGKADPAVVI